jgi:hypothetical protein
MSCNQGRKYYCNQIQLSPPSPGEHNCDSLSPVFLTLLANHRQPRGITGGWLGSMRCTTWDVTGSMSVVAEGRAGANDEEKII